MMTPEQQQAFRTRIQSDAISGVALDRIVAAVDDMLAAERAATVERCKMVILGGRFLSDDAQDAKLAREVAAAIDRDAAIRAQGDGSKPYAEGVKFYLKKGDGNG